MQHRDMITIQKVISEMQIGIDMLGETDLDMFLENEMLKRALGMTAISMESGRWNERYNSTSLSDTSNGRCVYDSSGRISCVV